MPKKHPQPLPFEVFLEAANATFDYRIAECGQGLASTAKYLFRYSVDEVEIGVKATFDRWANSQDFVCRPLPGDQETFDALIGALDQFVREKRELPEYGSFDIWPMVRKMRRENRSAERIAAKQEAYA